MAHRTLTPELGVFLGEVGTTPRGTIGIDYVMVAKLQEPIGDAGRLWQQAYANLAGSLEVEVAELDDQPLFILKREEGMAASAIALPDFSDRAGCRWRQGIRSSRDRPGAAGPGRASGCTARLLRRREADQILERMSVRLTAEVALPRKPQRRP